MAGKARKAAKRPAAKRARSCSCSSETAAVLACSGASNVGQICNEVAKMLDAKGVASFYCLAGIGGHISGMIASVRGCSRVLVLDGCPVGCGKAAMEQAGLREYDYLVLTELGIEKNHDHNLGSRAIKKAYAAARGKLGA